jgi:hypothetical protein
MLTTIIICSSALKYSILEQNMMTYARQLLFISLITDDEAEMSTQEKAQLFLELLGNVSLQPATAKVCLLF